MLGLADVIINNLLNNIFHVIWLYALATEPKYTKKKRIFFCVAAAVVAEALSLFTIFNYGIDGAAFSILYIVGSLVFASLYIFLLQGGKKLKAVFIFFSYICVWAAVYVVSMVLCNNFFSAFPSAVWILRSAFNIILLSAYYIFFKPRIKRSGAAIEAASGTLVVVSGMAYLLLPVLMILYAFNEQTAWSLAVTVFLLIFSVAVYFLIFRFLKQLGRESELKQIEAQNKLLNEAVHNSELIETQAKRSRHDLRHHNNLLLEYAKAGDTSSIIEYLAEYERGEDKKLPPIYSANKTVNNILRSYIAKAESNGIAVTVNVRMNEQTTILDVDLVSIIGNMLDNAINGCLAAGEEKRMDIQIYHKDGKLVIMCKNTCRGDILFENDLPKRKTGDGGVGITSILMSAEKYKGDTSFCADDGVFSCIVLLNEIQK